MKTKKLLPVLLVSIFLMSFSTLWLRYTDALTGFSVDMPNTPAVVTGTHPITHSPMTTARQVAAGHPEFVAIGIKTSSALTNFDKVINDEIDIFCTSNGIAKPATYPPLKHAATYDYKIIKLHNSTIYADLKVCVKGANIYNLIVKNNSAYAPATDVNKFFNSFRP